MQKVFLYICFVLGMTCVACGARQTALYTPIITVSHAAMTTDTMRDALLQACAAHGWTVEEVWPGTLEAQYKANERHTVRVALAYDARSCTIHYRDSTSMGYFAKSDGTVTIHPVYNNWLEKLEKTIQQNVASHETPSPKDLHAKSRTSPPSLFSPPDSSGPSRPIKK